ncbi:hypothetical protein XMM379_002261 [Aliiroseovarius sp. xm-m-379]|uniref:hypothetical protein n=1 Tax=unclassified Aliiroseovarius TaxID=2623558 RepID=UPI0015687602|nr:MULTISPECIES: hypothetical protein [unclassified Aliiroseovarius]NRP13792.1 hypothetical protein [Aliiroseovarius sp. xm-d-517]NRP25563.1 hypothetical protein [Aliiroseovarius sp. xm-m-379]NRP29556.1 hypothetical protein [Aliiroseovarius sp. xm-m-314]NRP34362.1 hypothetical protein [Aliiroseovarius sp. xm-a-104]NRP41679.1 hypothetical protein [Aliiroseovarius sp. xm-m-339-2]
MELVISLIAGAVGGNVAGKTIGSINQGTLINSIAGILGGGLGGQLLSMVGAGGLAGGGMDLVGIIGQLASGGVGGGVVLAIVSLIRNAIAK